MSFIYVTELLACEDEPRISLFVIERAYSWVLDPMRCNTYWEPNSLSWPHALKPMRLFLGWSGGVGAMAPMPVVCAWSVGRAARANYCTVLGCGIITVEIWMALKM